MKKFKSIIIMLIVLLLTMSCFVACGPSDDNVGDWDIGNGPVSNQGGTTNTDPDNPSDPGNTTPRR